MAPVGVNLGVKEVQYFAFVLLAQRSTHAHMSQDGSGDSRGKPSGLLWQREQF